MNRSKNYKLLFTTILVIAGTIKADAQLTGFHSAYFTNEYLSNPAMAGMEKGLDLNLGYQQQWGSIPGAPKLQNLTADYNSGNRVGLGVNVNSDQAGLISRTRVMATYAYHLPVSQTDKLNFGLSLGINDTYVDYSRVVGDQGDAQATAFNQRSVYVDGDFGIAYTGSRLTIQGTLPNLKSVFFASNDDNLDIDRSTFFTAASYKIPFSNQYSTFSLEPKVAFRGVKGFDNIFDAGFNFDMISSNLSFSGVYHSNQTVTGGFGLSLQTMDLLLAYTYNNGPLQAYANNTFEFGVKLKLFRK